MSSPLLGLSTPAPMQHTVGPHPSVQPLLLLGLTVSALMQQKTGSHLTGSPNSLLDLPLRTPATLPASELLAPTPASSLVPPLLGRPASQHMQTAAASHLSRLGVHAPAPIGSSTSGLPAPTPTGLSPWDPPLPAQVSANVRPAPASRRQALLDRIRAKHGDHGLMQSSHHRLPRYNHRHSVS